MGELAPRETVRASVQDTITGKWLDIAIAIEGGSTMLPEIERAVHRPGDVMTHTRNVVGPNVDRMLSAGLIYRKEAELLLTKRGRRQLANSRAAG